MDNIKLLYEEIGKYVTQLIRQQNIPLLISATVVSYSAPLATIRISGSSVDIPNIKNLSGQTLTANDLVEVVVKNGDYSNIFIGWKR